MKPPLWWWPWWLGPVLCAIGTLVMDEDGSPLRWVGLIGFAASVWVGLVIRAERRRFYAYQQRFGPGRRRRA